MTNKKFKARNLDNNMLLNRITLENSKILCKLIIALRQTGVGVERLQRLVQDYAAGNVKKFEKLSEEDAQNVVVCRQLKLHGMEFDELRAFIDTQNVPQYSGLFRRTLAENVAIFFFQLNESLGYGRNRFMRLLDEAKEYEGDPIKEVEEMLGVTFSHSLPDVEDYREKPVKFSKEEYARMRRDMEGLRALQERSKM